VCGNLSGGAGRFKRGVGFLSSASAGEYFFRWLKSRNRPSAGGCSKIITIHNKAVKSGEYRFWHGGIFGWHRRC